MTARIFNILIGGWLILSGMFWPHTSAELAYTVLGGALTLAFAVASGHLRWARHATLAVGLLVLLLTLGLSRGSVMFWNNSIAAAAIVIASLFDRGPEGIRHARELYGRV
jgi:hypothetical protein